MLVYILEISGIISSHLYYSIVDVSNSIKLFKKLSSAVLNGSL